MLWGSLLASALFVACYNYVGGNVGDANEKMTWRDRAAVVNGGVVEHWVCTVSPYFFVMEGRSRKLALSVEFFLFKFGSLS